MKYFTPERYQHLQDFSSDAAMDTADAEWAKAAQLYERQLTRIRSELPQGMRELMENFYLHDADVLSLGYQGETFIVVLRLDVPPRELLVLNYRLVRDAAINSAAFVSRSGSGPVQWMYDEVSVVRGKNSCFRHSILLSNGWELGLFVSDVTVLHAQPVYPEPGMMLVPVKIERMPKSA
jgi:hypothetical protein